MGHRATALYAAASARRIDRLATAALGGDGYVLMQRAGQAAWRALLQRWPQARRLAVACGSGNNGGDGYVLARLALQSGREVRVVHPAGGGPRAPQAQRACTDYLAAGGRVDLFPTPLDGADVLVDALFGIGLEQAPRDDAAALIAALDAAAAPVFALDVPSGVDADRGSVPGAALHAQCTLQFIVPHAGLYTGAALDRTGELLLDALGVDAGAWAGEAPATATLLEAGALRAWLPPRRRDTHKGRSGHVLCVGGDHGGGGAVVLCAEAALRGGAGLASVATRAEHVAAALARRPEAMARAVAGAGDLRALLDGAGVVACGPGLGRAEWGRELYRCVLDSGHPLVLDADALNLLAEAPRLPGDAVLTPHPGEAARLLGADTATVQRDRYAAAAELAQRYRCTVALKGAGTIVAAPDRAPRVLAAGNPGMATGGMGDLLTGAIAAMRAQGLPAFEAACAGVLLHGLAGDAAAHEAGQRGLLPSDLLPWLRRLANPGRT
ncbi:bifunctional ADP-dependent NAD(P)H-hydrate dehydratase/NAD(P)H-hydrate epimerase [Pseudoxanthomonas broegbernensis]|uniref:Bifunctional NAD(P)H-hydrate repair enzyme n=1 Tax=Pseudoxanthomonas broegbernensis TaxID=83619 RepID=A0A7V8GQC4_9GAMM|nr:NAD(P)H-hydrate dehydratase [Pseudoxanthomonas broegbernensis]KAF1688134.1 bifunctional ADP-dependent NAD(P)H-hydrate dehydratase/NAD(P)H-hydrate epimerase [Pseudoxanthomonas broegbernensis]MBB6065182.1 NAD(P)H-hydrate epimerase [Pseudoxanthomonas broegbernensis]